MKTKITAIRTAPVRNARDGRKLTSGKSEPCHRKGLGAPIRSVFALACLLFSSPVFAHGGISALAGLGQLMLLLSSCISCVVAAPIARHLVKKYQNKWLYLTFLVLVPLLSVAIFLLALASL